MGYVRSIYVLHNILVEDYSSEEEKLLPDLLKKCFNKSYQKFSDNTEYLFFVGKILYISECYFNIDDDTKPVEKRLTFKMQEQAFNKEPYNKLFEWAYRFSLNDESASYLAQYILQSDKIRIEWLKSKGFPSHYVLDSLNQSKDKYEEVHKLK